MANEVKYTFSADVKSLKKGIEEANKALKNLEKATSGIDKATSEDIKKTGKSFEDLGKSTKKTEKDVKDFEKEASKSTKGFKDKTEKDLDDVEKQIEKTGSSFSNFAGILGKGLGIGIAGATAVIAGLSAVGKVAIESANAQIEAETRLTNASKGRFDATQEQINGLKNLASEQQKIGVVGDEVIISGQAQLATYVNSTEALAELTPAIATLTAQQGGYNATTENAIAVGDKFGKVLSGDIGALKDAGIAFTEAQEEILRTGTELERASIIAEIVEDNFGGVNEALASTPEGRFKQIANNIGDLQEELGMALLPVLENILPVLSDLADNFATLFDDIDPTVFEDLGTLIGESLSGITEVFSGVDLGSVFNILTESINSLLPVVDLLIQNVFPILISTFESLLPIISDVVAVISDTLVPVFDALSPTISLITDTLLPVLGDLLVSLIEPIGEVVTVLAESLAPVFELLIPIISNIIESLLPPLVSLFETLTPIITVVAEVLSASLGVALSAIGPIIDLLLPIIEFLINIFNDVIGVVSDVVTTIKDSLIKTFDKVKDAVQKVIDKIKDFVDGIKNAVNKVKGFVGKLNPFSKGGADSDIVANASLNILPTLGNLTGLEGNSGNVFNTTFNVSQKGNMTVNDVARLKTRAYATNSYILSTQGSS